MTKILVDFVTIALVSCGALAWWRSWALPIELLRLRRLLVGGYCPSCVYEVNDLLERVDACPECAAPLAGILPRSHDRRWRVAETSHVLNSFLAFMLTVCSYLLWVACSPAMRMQGAITGIVHHLLLIALLVGVGCRLTIKSTLFVAIAGGFAGLAAQVSVFLALSFEPSYSQVTIARYAFIVTSTVGGCGVYFALWYVGLFYRERLDERVQLQAASRHMQVQMPSRVVEEERDQ